jgi:hypothetical protein
MVNNFTSDDTWRFCYTVLPDRGDKTKWSMTLPKDEELLEFSIVTNVLNHKITELKLYFDDNPEACVFEVRPVHDRQYFSVAGRKAKKITIEIACWEESGLQNVIGIENFWLRVKRPESFCKNVKPLINIGGFVRYNMGKGGILLNQLNILQKEENPINADKKGKIVKTLLWNLGAVFEK